MAAGKGGSGCGLVSEQMHGDYGQDTCGDQRGAGDEHGGSVRAKDRDERSRGLAKVVVVSPLVSEPGEASGEDEERERDEENPEAEVGTRGVPVDDLLGGVRGLELRRLDATEEERSHKEHGWEEEREFQSGEGAAE